MFDASAGIVSRGTRVFQARRLESNGNEVGDPVVVKDIWMDDDRDREGDIIRKVCESLSEEDRPLLDKHLLTVLSHGNVVGGSYPGIYYAMQRRTSHGC